LVGFGWDVKRCEEENRELNAKLKNVREILTDMLKRRK